MPTPSADSRVIYVSSSGDDNNEGSASSPLRTISAGISRLRDGYPDYLFLKRGDVWRETLGSWRKRGRSEIEPMVVGTYGTGERPILYCGDSTGLNCSSSSVTPPVSHLLFTGIDFYAQTRDPDHTEFNGGSSGGSGFRWLKGTRDLEVNDCVFRFFKTGLIIQKYSGTKMINIRVTNNKVLNSYSDSGHSQGLYLDGVEDSLINGNCFDHNGWNPVVPGAHPTIYNHNMYIQKNCSNINVENNFISRAASHGCQLRCSGLVENNFFIQNPISLSLSYRASTLPANYCVARNNVIVEGTDIGINPLSGDPRGWGIDLEDRNYDDVFEVVGNIIAHVKVDGPNLMSIRDRSSKATYDRNIVWDWPSESGHGVPGKFDSEGPFEDPDRMFEDQFGPTGDFVMGSVSTSVVNDWYRDGFKEPQPEPPVVEPEPPTVEPEPPVEPTPEPTPMDPDLVGFLNNAALACAALAAMFKSAADYHKS